MMSGKAFVHAFQLNNIFYSSHFPVSYRDTKSCVPAWTDAKLKHKRSQYIITHQNHN
jgi:hypothetical protein